MTEYIPHKPTVKQTAALLLPHREVFYGGAAGGGKSDYLLMAALQYVDVPGYNALILRRTFRQLALPSAIMARSQEWLTDTDAKWNQERKVWTFPSSATLTFGHMENARDRYDYQGADFHMVGYDELTQFLDVMYLYLFSRMRRIVNSPVPTRMRSTSNPGNIGHEWVKRRFIKPGASGRIFIKALLDDNPHINQEEYRENLAQLDPVTRRQLEEGDWDALPEGKMFKREWFTIVPDYPKDAHRLRYWDMAATKEKEGTDPDYTVGTLAAEKHGMFFIVNVHRDRLSPKESSALIKQCAMIDTPSTQIWMEQEPGASGKIVIDYYKREILLGYAFRGDKVTGSKTDRALPFSTAAESGNVYLVDGLWVEPWLQEVCAYPTPGIHDDQLDSASGAHSKLCFGGNSQYTRIKRTA